MEANQRCEELETSKTNVLESSRHAGTRLYPFDGVGVRYVRKLTCFANSEQTYGGSTLPSSLET